mgnify:CR=1 FL=1
MGRKKKIKPETNGEKAQLDHPVQVNFTTEQKGKLETGAAARGLSLAAFIRSQALAGL